jgi:hypothetical protein
MHRPVDVSSREKEISDRLDKEREMNRTNSRSVSDRGFTNHTKSHSSTDSPDLPTSSESTVSATVRPSVSFASVATTKALSDREAGPLIQEACMSAAKAAELEKETS